jgi:hypothetical protein
MIFDLASVGTETVRHLCSASLHSVAGQIRSHHSLTHMFCPVQSTTYAPTPPHPELFLINDWLCFDFLVVYLPACWW